MENKEKFIKEIKALLPTQEQIGFNNPAYAFGWVDAVNAIVDKLVKESDSLPDDALHFAEWMDIESTEHQDSTNPLLLIASVRGSVYLTENQIAELAQIGSQYLYLGAMDEGRISYGGIMEILKRYEELRKTEKMR